MYITLRFSCCIPCPLLLLTKELNKGSLFPHEVDLNVIALSLDLNQDFIIKEIIKPISQ